VLFIEIIIVVLLGVIVYQDFKSRSFYWIILPILFGLITILGIDQGNSLMEFLMNSLANFCILLFQFIVITVFYSIKEKQFTNVIDKYLGLGDILLLIAICGITNTVNFILVYTLSLILVLIAVIIHSTYVTKFSNRPKVNTIPLAGGISLIMIGCFFVKLIYGLDFYNDFLILNMIL